MDMSIDRYEKLKYRGKLTLYNGKKQMKKIYCDICNQETGIAYELEVRKIVLIKKMDLCSKCYNSIQAEIEKLLMKVK